MIKPWKKFNEMFEDSFIKDKLEKIKEIFIEFEDEDIISYSFGRFGPRFKKDVNYSDFLKYAKPLKNEKDFFIEIDIYFPGKGIESYGGNALIDSKDINLLNELFSAINRLNDAGFDFKLDFNSNSDKYKPITIMIYI